MTEKAQNRKIEKLEKQLAQKDMVIAELATENLGLKKIILARNKKNKGRFGYTRENQ